MSTKENDMYLEDIQSKFEECVSEENWACVSSLQAELEDGGYTIYLPELLSPEDRKEYKAWVNAPSGDESLQEPEDRY